jgi:hypothetical protein
MRTLFLCSVLSLIVGGALTLYYFWWADYYFPARYEVALVPSALG